MTYSTHYFGSTNYSKRFKRKIFLSTGVFLCYQIINNYGIPTGIIGENRFI